MKVIRSEVGIEIAVMIVDLKLNRKIRMTIIAKLRPRRPSTVRS